MEMPSLDSVRSAAEHPMVREKVQQVQKLQREIQPKKSGTALVDFAGEQESETGWDAGVRACLPVGLEGRVASHGDVVQWGECVCIVLSEPHKSSWAMIWKNELKKRAIRIEDISLDAEGSTKTKQMVYRHKVQQRLAKLHLKGLAPTVPACAHICASITALVVEDDIRFLPVNEDDVDPFLKYSTEAKADANGIVIGCRHHATELKRRYGDLFFLAQRAGVVVCVLLRSSSATPKDANRLSKYLRFGVCAPENEVYDFQTPPLSSIFTDGGGIVCVGGDVASASKLVRELQRCDAKAMEPSVTGHMSSTEPKPHGVMAHIARDAKVKGKPSAFKVPEVLTEEDVNKNVAQRRSKALKREIVQELEDVDDRKRVQLVAYCGEDWGALASADVGITWESSSSPGAFEARQLANLLLPSNSPRDLLRILGEVALESILTDNPLEGKSCSVS
eukprot:CAMPEP_0173416238 /NCGR_PEP_ID=MMETSP1356-20130122/85152_1 /TAXON_ID=77927 ORGANISM="Hemiselmis virescens, Strain PCC157" /NCGR_SAMPLE_ID=MMETSP1356 /ASSEMBLY_ACC=CAM_ASM_000847 /LENGTH=448 /DNA_ID=CAMNT_0014378543 /DNA_START=8 /DNA_END=1354 /DNA_ORIENTATION=-